uniref:von Willebrand factor A domain containing 5B2 n=1 Tax=Leptobrachium leishanense TaxID=445787 RepID=A0A8C5PB96_9ANUR
MPGLYNASSWVQLPLESSSVNACANGYSLGIAAHLTYLNTSSESVQAMFIYLLEDGEVVTNFEAIIGNQKVHAQVQSQSRMEECCSECQWESMPCYCSNGHLVLDADTARGLFVLSMGIVPPSTLLNISLRTNRELQTLPSGAVRVILNSTLTPLAPEPGTPMEQGVGLCDDSPTSCFGGVSGAGGSPWLLMNDSSPQMLPSSRSNSFSAALTGPATNSQHYQFSFRLKVQGPCLLAGIESPSHALRADASPFAVSASSVWISLAEDYKCDRAVEIILHPSEPHLPHLSLERGAKSFLQYEAQIKQRKDFIRAIKKSSDPEKQVNFVRRRFHKDLHLTPVLMLNFCPDLAAFSSLSNDLPTVTREIIFFLHLMGEPSCNARDALHLAVRSLPARTLLNVAGGMLESKTLFPTSRQCSNETLDMASEYIQRGSLGGSVSNLYSALSRTLSMSVHRGYPRQLFLFTDNTITFPGKVIELLRRHAKTTRLFCFGLGSVGERRFLQRAAGVCRGTVEMLHVGERLQPKLIKSLRKALEPALSDITIDWYMPDTMEALLTPNEFASLYPGDSLIGYCALYNTASFHSHRNVGQRVRCGSFSSVFHSLDESKTTTANDTMGTNPSTGTDDLGRALQEISQEISMEFSACAEDPEKSGDSFLSSDIRKRIVQLSYVQDQYMLTHCSVSTDPTQAQMPPSISSDPTQVHTYGSTSSESGASRDAAFGDCTTPYPPVASQQKSMSQSEEMRGLKKNTISSCKASLAQSSEELARRKALIKSTMSCRSFSSPHGELDMMRLRNILDKVSQNPDMDMRASHRESLADSCNIMSPNLDWDMLVDAQYLFSASPCVSGGSTGSCGGNESVWQCRAVIRGFISGKSLTWETSASLESLLSNSAVELTDCIEEEGEDDIHHLAAHSVIQDNEEMAWRESDIEHGSPRRFRLKAAQTSKSCSQISRFTCHIPIDPVTQDTLPGQITVCRGGRSKRSLRSNSGSLAQGESRCLETLEEVFGTAGETAVVPSSSLSLASDISLQTQQRQEGQSLTASCTHKSSDKSLSSRLSLGKRRIRSISGKLPPLKPPCITKDKECCLEPQIQDYLPLVSLQSPEGFFTLNGSFSNMVQIPLQRLLRASPYSSHRGSLSPVSEPVPEQNDVLRGGTQAYKGGSQPQVPVTHDSSFLPMLTTSCPEALCHQADSGRGSETDPCDTSPCPSEAGTDQDSDLEGCSWATAVALAWLEHRCAGFFIEWELLAARAEGWLRVQSLPEGLQLPVLKGAARHLFLLLRHWDENLNLNMFCYKPGDV